MTIIYVDVLLVLNLFVNYFLLLSTGMILHNDTKRLRILISAAIGSLFSLLIFLPSLGTLLMLMIKLILGVLLVIICFGFVQKSAFIKTALTFLGVNFIYGGVMLAIWMLFCPTGMYWNNGVAYFNISAFMLVLSTIAAYAVVQLICFLLNRKVNSNTIVTATLSWNECTTQFRALRDTGNHLVDGFTGKRVVVCEYDAVKNLIPNELKDFFKNPTLGNKAYDSPDLIRHKIRLIPFHTVGGKSLVGAFPPDEFYIGQKKIADVLVGVTTQSLSQGEFKGILHADMS